MRDKPIQAELVRADEIKPGDHILFAGQVIEVESVNAEPCYETRGFDFKEENIRVHSCADDFDDWQLVARILPEVKK